MSTTLRRKMFKLGGSTNTHGVGITSGLEYRTGMKKGGSVQEPQATFGVGNNANKTIGPDGKVREANYAFIPLGLQALARSLAAQAVKRNVPFSSYLKNFSTRGPGVKEFVRGPGGPSSVSRSTTVGPYLPNNKYKVGSSLGQQGLRAAQVAAPFAGYGLSTVPAITDRLGISDNYGGDMQDSNFQKLIRSGAKFGTDYSLPGLATNVVQRLRSSDMDQKEKSLYNIMAGKNKSKADESGQKAAESSEDQFKNILERAQQRSNLYAQMMYEDDKVGKFGRAVSAAAPALGREDYAEAFGAAGDQLGVENQQRSQVKQAASQMALQEVMMEDQQQKATVQKLLSVNDIAGAERAERYNTFRNQVGDKTIGRLPIGNDGKIDGTKITESTVYFDVSNLSGALYVSFDSKGSYKTFDDITSAQNHAAS